MFKITYDAMRHALSGLAPLAWILASLVAVPYATAADNTWRYEFTPYVWAAGMDGTIRINNRPDAGLGVEQSFSDIMEKLDFGLMGAFEARKERWGILLDGVYFKVSDEGGVSGPLGFTSLAGNATVTQQLYALAGAYRLTERSGLVDVIGGLRYNSVKWDVTINASVPVVSVAARRFAQTEHWVDPYIGARIQYPLGKRWSLTGYADIGGFGLGSDLSWQAMAGTNYAFNPNLIGKIGYRIVYNKYSNDDFNYDMTSAGFYLGLGFRW